MRKIRTASLAPPAPACQWSRSTRSGSRDAAAGREGHWRSAGRGEDGDLAANVRTSLGLMRNSHAAITLAVVDASASAMTIPMAAVRRPSNSIMVSARRVAAPTRHLDADLPRPRHRRQRHSSHRVPLPRAPGADAAQCAGDDRSDPLRDPHDERAALVARDSPHHAIAIVWPELSRNWRARHATTRGCGYQCLHYGNYPRRCAVD